MSTPTREAERKLNDDPLKKSLGTLAQLALTVAMLWICYLLVAPFLSTIVWAIALAILCIPPYQAIESRLKNETVSGAVTVLLVAVIVVAPSLFIAARLASEVKAGVAFIQSQVSAGSWRDLIQSHPWLSALNDWIEQQLDLSSLLAGVASWVTSHGTSFARSSAFYLIGILVAFYALFYLLRDRREALATLKNLSPLPIEETDRLLIRVADTVRAVVYGTLVVAAVQGALGGFMFWLLDLRAPLFWGLVMGLLSIVPVLGSFVVWIPAAILLAIEGHWEKAMALSAWGALIVGTVDNFLRPVLVGGSLRMHTLTMFFSLLGGVRLFGASGLILGPVAVAMSMELLEFLRGHREDDLSEESRPLVSSSPEPWHCLSEEEVLEVLGVSAGGLSTAQAAGALAASGPNVLRQRKRVSPLSIFISQFNSVLIWILIGASVVSGFLGETVDAFVILAIVLLNAIVGFYQEFSAEKSIAALQKMTAPLARVWRDGVVTTIPSESVVPGEVLQLEAGDLVAADARLLSASSLSCVESVLTGESDSVAKRAEALKEARLPIAERVNMAFMGTTVASGSGRGVVVATGMGTEFGAIAQLIEDAGEATETPLQIRLAAFGRVLLWATLGIVVLLFGLGLLRGGDLFDLFMTSISLAVAALPESLPAVVTAALSLGVMRMSRRSALVRRLASVETLGSTNVICTDKTGTLTLGQMTVRALSVAGTTYEVAGEGYAPQGDIRIDDKRVEPREVPVLLTLAEVFVGCNNAYLEREGHDWKVVGDPTEAALLAVGKKLGADRPQLERDQPRQLEFPFDSDRKLHSILRGLPGGRRRLLVIGAPETLLERCSEIWCETGSRPLTEQDRAELARENSELAAKALRVLGAALRELDRETPTGRLAREDIERDLVFVGLAGLYDPPRPEAKAAVAECRAAGLRVVMITGDQPRTAVAIARELEVAAEDDEEALSGAELNELSDEVLKERVGHTPVYARVTAAHKLRIVRAWQANGAVVAMTGDGVNDAPAIKGADIGIAMGRTGAEATKQASDMIITDDNFATIVAAVEEGRGIYENIRKTLQYLLSCNAGELLLMTICIVVGLPAPLLPIHLLWINLVTDGPPALCLAADPLDSATMQRPPRSRDKEIADEPFLWTLLVIAAPTAGVSLAAYLFGLQTGTLELARTYAFLTLIFSQLLIALAVRSQTGPLLSYGLFSNSVALAVIVGSILLQLAIGRHPVLAPVLKSEPISYQTGLVLLGASTLPVLVFELVKFARSLVLARSREGITLAQGSESASDPVEFYAYREKRFWRVAAGVVIAACLATAVSYAMVERHLLAPISQQESEHVGRRRDLTAQAIVVPRRMAQVAYEAPGVIQERLCSVGDRVRATQLCMRIDPAPYRAAHEKAVRNLTAAKDRLEADRADLTAARVALAHERLVAAHHPNSRSRLRSYEAAVERAQAQAESDNALMAQRESELRAAAVAMERTKINSPIDGTVVAIKGDVGQIIEARPEAAPALVVATPYATIEALVETRDIGETGSGAKVSVDVPALPNRSFAGRIVQLDSSSGEKSLYNLIIDVADPDFLLKGGMKVDIRTGKEPD